MTAVGKAPCSEISLTAIFTGCTWLSCLVVGIVGIVIPYTRPRIAKSESAPMQAELLNVALTLDTTPSADMAPSSALLTPPPMAKPIEAPSAPALTPVAAPNAPVAFELPVAGLTRIVDVKQASYAAPEKPVVDNAANQPTVSQLTFGQGEGKQPMTYPERARSEGQEGTVRILFTVGTDGRTLAAEILSQSPWPLLNEAALKAVRERWQLARGPIRRHEVAIHFKIRK